VCARRASQVAERTILEPDWYTPCEENNYERIQYLIYSGRWLCCCGFENHGACLAGVVIFSNVLIVTNFYTILRWRAWRTNKESSSQQRPTNHVPFFLDDDRSAKDSGIRILFSGSKSNDSEDYDYDEVHSGLKFITNSLLILIHNDSIRFQHWFGIMEMSSDPALRNVDQWLANAFWFIMAGFIGGALLLRAFAKYKTWSRSVITCLHGSQNFLTPCCRGPCSLV